MVNLLNLDVQAIQRLLNSGKLTVEAAKEIAETIQSLVMSASRLQKLFEVHDIEVVPNEGYTDLATSPVTGSSLSEWQPDEVVLKRREMQQYADMMTKSVAAEQWAKGLWFGVQIAKQLAGTGAV